MPEILIWFVQDVPNISSNLEVCFQQKKSILKEKFPCVVLDVLLL